MASAVFINCPFDAQYQRKFRAIVFTLVYCGFEPRCSLEVADGSQNRLDKIMDIMGSCSHAIHDISRTQLSSGLPRFNMPFELGIFVGAKKFGGRSHSSKTCLVLDAVSYRYQRTSDIAGQDIQIHQNSFEEVILVVRNWLAQFNSHTLLPGDVPITQDYKRLLRQFPRICIESGITKRRILYNDFVNIIKVWIAKKGSIV